MAGTVTIGKQVIDADDPCAIYQALYAFKLRLMSGEVAEEVEHHSPVTNQRVKFTAANPEMLEAELDRLRLACDAQRGRMQPSIIHFNTSKGL